MIVGREVQGLGGDEKMRERPECSRWTVLSFRVM